eukprot:Em0015g1148a
MILPEWGVQGQLAVQSSSVLVVGVGGLGCPVAIYLAAAGIGEIGLVDYDNVELGNLHRQVLHTERTLGLSKVESAAAALKAMNSSTRISTHHILLNSQNALALLRLYDIVVDATDNVATRYLLNDACVLLQKPLISGSALRFEGQLTVYCWGGGPCYRCLFPSPPPPETVTSCSDGGVLGPVPGVIGTLQAMEVLKMAAGMNPSYSQRLLLFDAHSGDFRIVTLRPRNKQCVVCGDNPSIRELIDYEQFCGSGPNDKTPSIHLLTPADRITCADYKCMMDQGVPHLVIDVRESTEYTMCRLEHSENFPLKQLKEEAMVAKVSTLIGHIEAKLPTKSGVQVVVVCRRGNDSQKAVRLLKAQLQVDDVCIRDLVGGLTAWTEEIDPSFPKY